MTLYAIWEEGTTDLLIYTDYNSDEASIETSVSIGVSRPLGEWAQDNLSEIEREGYALVGFNTRADGTGLRLNLETDISGGMDSKYYKTQKYIAPDSK